MRGLEIRDEGKLCRRYGRGNEPNSGGVTLIRYLFDRRNGDTVATTTTTTTTSHVSEVRFRGIGRGRQVFCFGLSAAAVVVKPTGECRVGKGIFFYSSVGEVSSSGFFL